ncbi:hypothetical protein YC2023_122843 [Brassica napus]
MVRHKEIEGRCYQEEGHQDPSEKASSSKPSLASKPEEDSQCTFRYSNKEKAGGGQRLECTL